MAQIERNDILHKIHAVIQPLPYVHAMWEAGAAAFNRVDTWSDIDLQIDVEDEFADRILPIVESALRELSPLELVYRVQNPPFDLYAQVYYRLQETSPFLLLDLAVIRHSSPLKLLEPQMHGNAVVLLDRSGVVKDYPLDPDAWQKKLAARREELQISFPLFQTLTQKELRRGNYIEALAFYYSYTLRPLLELLRIQHAPYRYNFATRYVYYDLPREIVDRLEALYFIASPQELETKQRLAEVWFKEAAGPQV